MDQNKTALERAFELARSGKYLNVSDVKRALASEHYSSDTVIGGSLVRQLRRLISESR